LFTPGAAPHFVVKLRTVEEWTVLNDTDEIHDFHMHQVHFIVEAVNGIIKGELVYHCHLLDHEDKGMMATVLAQ
jgi:suppressor of ftsI